MKLTKLVEEIKQTEQDKQIAQLAAAMGAGFKQLGTNLTNNEDELKQDVEQAEIPVNESITAVAVIGMLLAAPRVVELIVKAFTGAVKLYKRFFAKGGAKTKEEQIEVATKIIQFTHTWHKKYILGLKWVMKVTGLFKKAGIKGEAAEDRAAELVYHVIIAGLAVYSGVQSYQVFKQALAASQAVPAATSAVDLAQSTADVAKLAKVAVDPSHNLLSLATLELSMASIKTGEVLTFLKKLGLA